MVQFLDLTLGHQVERVGEGSSLPLCSEWGAQMVRKLIVLCPRNLQTPSVDDGMGNLGQSVLHGSPKRRPKAWICDPSCLFQNPAKIPIL